MRPLNKVRALVPKQTAYPAAFVAEVETTTYASTDPPSTPWTDILVFRRASAADSWKVDLATGHAGTESIDGGVASDGYLEPTQKSKWINTSVLPEALRIYRQAWADNGVEPSGTPFVIGAYWTTQFGQQAYDGHARDTKLGMKSDVTYSAATDVAPMEFSRGNGWVITCFALRYEEVKKPLSGYLKQGSDRKGWGGILPPGAYKSVTITGVRQQCAVTPPARDGYEGLSGVRIMGGQGDQTNVTGVPL